MAPENHLKSVLPAVQANGRPSRGSLSPGAWPTRMIRLSTGLPTTTGLCMRGQRLHRRSAARCLSMAVEVMAQKRMEARLGSPSLANLRVAPRSVAALAAVAATAAAAAEAATAATAAAAAEPAAAAAAEAAAWAIFLGTGLVDGQLAPAELDAVDLLGCDLGLFSRSHGDEGEAARAARHLVHGDVNVGYGSELAEVRAELVFGCFEREISNV